MTEDIGTLEGADVLDLGGDRTLVLKGEEGTVHVGLGDGSTAELLDALGEGGDGGGGFLNTDAIDDALGGGF